MPSIARTCLALACSLIVSGCGPDLIDPGGLGGVPGKDIITLTLSPRDVAIDQGAEVFLTAAALVNGRIPVASRVTYSTSAAAIASVNEEGQVIGVAPGTAVITAKTTIGEKTYADSVTVIVWKPDILGDLVLTARSGGWEPTPAHVAAGGAVTWVAGHIDAAGTVTTKVYLMNQDYAVIDSLDLTKGPVSRTFQYPGLIRYCSNICWDPPERGVIHVH